MNAAIEKVQKAGIEVMGGFILGFDTDTDDVSITNWNLSGGEPLLYQDQGKRLLIWQKRTPMMFYDV